jgi:hypothetical protein
MNDEEAYTVDSSNRDQIGRQANWDDQVLTGLPQAVDVRHGNPIVLSEMPI